MEKVPTGRTIMMFKIFSVSESILPYTCDVSFLSSVLGDNDSFYNTKKNNYTRQ